CSCTACPEDNTRGEVCDGRDNDCDGVTDNIESRVLLDGCEALEGAFATACADGVCLYACENGRVDTNGDVTAGSGGNGCECAITNGGQETCDGIDNDCDGVIDGHTQPCASACGEGIEVCTGGVWEGCTAPAPETEVCDGLDNDCDGTIDDDPEPVACPIQDGVCQGAMSTCVDGQNVCADAQYAQAAAGSGWAFEGIEATEVVCDGLDNNCDGRADEHCCPVDDDLYERGFTGVAELSEGFIVQAVPSVAVSDDGVASAVAWTETAMMDGDVRLWIGSMLGTPSQEGPFRATSDAALSIFGASVWDGIGFGLVWIDVDTAFDGGEANTIQIPWERRGTSGERLSETLGLFDEAYFATPKAFEDLFMVSTEDGSGRFVLAWSEYAIGDDAVCDHPDPEAHCVRARLYGPDGLPVGQAIELSDVVGDVPNARWLRLAKSTTTSSYLALWQDLGSGFAPDYLRWRKVDIVGGLVGPSQSLRLDDQSTRNGVVEPTVLSVEGGYLVVYEETAEERRQAIRFLRLDEDGAILQVGDVAEPLPDATEQFGPAAHKFSEQRVAVFWVEELEDDTSSIRMAMLDLTEMSFEVTTLVSNIAFVIGTSPLAAAPLLDPLEPGRVLGSLLAASIRPTEESGYGVYVGRISAGRFMCFDDEI
ncbi:MAG: putative metal-binding motif-containing protein, partial [Myxococcota bacterium]